MYRSVLKLVRKRGYLPVIVDVESDMRYSEKDSLLFNSLDRKSSEITLVIISG